MRCRSVWSLLRRCYPGLLVRRRIIITIRDLWAEEVVGCAGGVDSRCGGGGEGGGRGRGDASETNWPTSLLT